MVSKMRIFTFLILALSISLPNLVLAEEEVVFSNVSAGIFRFQVKLAEQGNAEAQYIVGEMYEKGAGVTKNKAQALIWFEKSAAQGHKKSGYKLLFLEIQSNGLNDYTKTQLGGLRKEAASGSADAQYFLGKMYAAGVGMPKSLNHALTWLNKATFNGIAEAEHEAIAVEEELNKIRERQAAKRSAALVAAQKRKAEEERSRAAWLKKEKKRKAAEAAKRKTSQSAEAQRAAAQRSRMEEERKLLEEEKLRLEKEKQLAEAELARNAKKEQTTKKVEPESSYESDPCKGKSARFLSTCR